MGQQNGDDAGHRVKIRVGRVRRRSENFKNKRTQDERKQPDHNGCESVKCRLPEEFFIQFLKIFGKGKNLDSRFEIQDSRFEIFQILIEPG